MQLQLHKTKPVSLCWRFFKKLKFPLSFCELLFISKMFHYDIKTHVPKILTDLINKRDSAE